MPPDFPAGGSTNCRAAARRWVSRGPVHGQMYPLPDAFLKQPTDSGSRCLGSHSTTSGRKMQNTMAARKTT